MAIALRPQICDVISPYVLKVEFETEVGLIIVLRRHRTREFGEITQIRALRCSRSFNVTSLGTNRELMYDFLLALTIETLQAEIYRRERFLKGVGLRSPIKGGWGRRRPTTVGGKN